MVISWGFDGGLMGFKSIIFMGIINKDGD